VLDKAAMQVQLHQTVSPTPQEFPAVLWTAWFRRCCRSQVPRHRQAHPRQSRQKRTMKKKSTGLSMGSSTLSALTPEKAMCPRAINWLLVRASINKESFPFFFRFYSCKSTPLRCCCCLACCVCGGAESCKKMCVRDRHQPASEFFHLRSANHSGPWLAAV